MRLLFDRDRNVVLLLFFVSLASASIFISQEYVVAGTLGFPLDDSWIHLVFARNIAQGDFFSFNPHQPVAGSTSPLWTLILSLQYFLTSNAVYYPKVLGIVLNGVTGVVSWRLCEHLGLKRSAAVMSAIIILCVPRMVWAAVSGMEVSLYVCCTMGSLYAYLRWSDNGNWRQYVSWGLAAVGAWSRPELSLLPCLFVLHQSVLRYMNRASQQKRNTDTLPIIPWRNVFVGVGLFAVMMLPFVALNEFLSGVPLPLTFYAKEESSVRRLLLSGEYLQVLRHSLTTAFTSWINVVKWLWLQDNVYLAFATLAGLVVLGYSMLRKTTFTVARSGLILIALVLIIYPSVRALVTGVVMFGQWGRYAAHTTPLAIVFGSVMLSWWMRKRLMTFSAAKRLYIGAAIAGTLFLPVYYVLGSYLVHSTEGQQSVSFLNTVKQDQVFCVIGFLFWNIAITTLALRSLKINFSTDRAIVWMFMLVLGFTLIEDWRKAPEYGRTVANQENVQFGVGRWLRDHTPVGTVYASNDIGMAYVAEKQHLIDIMGLVEPKVMTYMHTKSDTDESLGFVLREYKPEYVVCFDNWFPRTTDAEKKSGALELIDSVPAIKAMAAGDWEGSVLRVYKFHPALLSTRP